MIKYSDELISRITEDGKRNLQQLIDRIKVDKTAHAKRVAELVEKAMVHFNLAKTNSPIVSQAIGVVENEGLPESYAWLFAAVELLEQNRLLMEQAEVNIRTAVPTLIVDPNNIFKSIKQS